MVFLASSVDLGTATNFAPVPRGLASSRFRHTVAIVYCFLILNKPKILAKANEHPLTAYFCPRLLLLSGLRRQISADISGNLKSRTTPYFRKNFRKDPAGPNPMGRQMQR